MAVEKTAELEVAAMAATTAQAETTSKAGTKVLATLTVPQKDPAGCTIVGGSLVISAQNL